ncbi:MAG: hypothetical protein K2X98_03470, partial [Alphaproteobacteria bacterium]|nr:hypothetical protein [Alphaproteobacteria bacterium]
MDLAEDVLSSKDASTLRPSLPIDPVEDFLSQPDLKYKRPTLSIDQLRDLTHHCSKKMQYFDKILAGNDYIGTEDHFDFKKVLSVTEGDNIPLSEFVDIIDQNIHQQTFCRKEQVFAKSIVGKTSQYYNSQWRIWEKRHHFFSNYNDSEWTEDSFSWPHLRKENTLLLNQIMLWTTILHNVTEWHETYKEKYDIVLCQPLVEQLSGESLNVTNNIVYRACSFSDSIKALKKLINDLKKIQPTLFLLCEHDEQRLSEIMYRLGFNGPSYNNAMHAGMDNFPKAVLNLEMLKSVYEKKA